MSIYRWRKEENEELNNNANSNLALNFPLSIYLFNSKLNKSLPNSPFKMNDFNSSMCQAIIIK